MILKNTQRNNNIHIIYNCPKCKNARIITLHQYYNINSGISTGKCKKCGIVPNSGRFIKGTLPWNTGKKMPPEFGRKISQNKERNFNISKARKGIPLTESHRSAITGIPHFNARGSKHHNWRGGITPTNRVIRDSLDYKLWRKAVFEKDSYTCNKCKQIGGKLHAHHIKPFAIFPKLRFKINNGITLCEKHHKEIPIIHTVIK